MLLSALLLLLPLVARAQTARDPEHSDALRHVARVTADHAMVVTANPYATQAALEMLRSGGNAVDAAATAEWVLNVVEPESSGLGGGGFAVVYAAKSGEVAALDGRETAPAGVTPQLFLGPDGKPIRFYPERITGGRAVGVPGVLAMLALALERYGTRSLAETLQPAIHLAEQGFPVSPRLAASLHRQRERLAHFAATRAVFFDHRPGHEGETLPAGTLLRQPELAKAFRLIAAQGPDAFYRGPIGKALVAAVRDSPVAPGVMTAADLAGYRARLRPPVRTAWHGYTLYGMGPPSSGATTIFELLNLLATQPLAKGGPLSAPAVHHFVQAARLAYADRARYLGDPDFVPVPTAGLVDPAYAAERARSIVWDAPLGPVHAGTPPGVRSARAWAPQRADTESHSTTHLSIADAQGNLVSMTNTVEQAFGSGMVVPGWGFFLNNELTDFAAEPRDAEGRLRANAVAPGKRPRSSMAPTLVFRGHKPVLVIGSPGGSRIIQFVAEVIVRVLDYGMSLQDAIEAPHATMGGHSTDLEPPLAETALPAALERLGHHVRIQAQASGLHGIRFDAQGRLHGGADPRREGVAAGY
ncbi:MAG TPA: gamma-glutamyltransferase [bacterium]|nr:gamma-glutamyltransferase [bacterium]